MIHFENAEFTTLRTIFWYTRYICQYYCHVHFRAVISSGVLKQWRTAVESAVGVQSSNISLDSSFFLYSAYLWQLDSHFLVSVWTVVRGFVCIGWPQYTHLSLFPRFTLLIFASISLYPLAQAHLYHPVEPVLSCWWFPPTSLFNIWRTNWTRRCQDVHRTADGVVVRPCRPKESISFMSYG